MSFLVLGALACDQQRQPPLQAPAPPPTAADLERYRRDSAQYVVDSAKWAHDVFVLDSISRSINTDALYRLYHLELAARDPAAIEHAILCETDHLFTVYGDEPAGRAETRMEDTVHTSAERDSSNAIFARLREKDPVIGLSYQKGNYNCGQETLAATDASVLSRNADRRLAGVSAATTATVSADRWHNSKAGFWRVILG